MKFKWISFLLTCMIFSSNVFSQEVATAKIAEIKVKTSAQCGQCKDRLERAMAFEKGIISSDLNVKSKIFTIKYKPSKTTPEKIRKAISETGYDADEMVANTKAYNNLPACCKKTDDHAHDKHTDK